MTRRRAVSTLSVMDTLTLLASGQAGLVTTSQATALGWDRRTLARAVRHQRLVHLGRGLYALPSPDLANAEDRLRALSRGALLLYPDAVLSHVSAALADGLPLTAVHRRATVLRPVETQVRTQSFVIHPFRGEDVVDTPLGPAVDAATTVAQLTMDSGVTAGVVAADAALHRGLFKAEALQDITQAVRGWPHSARLAMLLNLMDGRSESVGESRLRLMMRLAGIESEPQALIRDEYGSVLARVDFLVKDSMVILEFDGLVKYSDGGVPALVAEKRREDRLRSLGYLVIRVTWDELSNPGVLLARIRRAIRVASPNIAVAR